MSAYDTLCRADMRFQGLGTCVWRRNRPPHIVLRLHFMRRNYNVRRRLHIVLTPGVNTIFRRHTTRTWPNYVAAMPPIICAQVLVPGITATLVANSPILGGHLR
jgi:hypothetical protein